MQRRLFPTALLLAAVIVGGFFVLRSATGSKADTVQFLWVLSGAHGTLSGPDDAHLTLRLAGARPWLTRFDDRPMRDAARVANRDFVSRWNLRFAHDPPNAVLSYDDATGTPRQLVLELRLPQW
ncbi:MAG: hypothetical protein ABUS54_01995, partial [Actinomycetota bacterium]